MSAVDYLVGRHHVGESYLAVVRFVLNHLQGGRKAFLACDKESRRKLISHIVKTHKRNRNVYTRVMRGL